VATLSKDCTILGTRGVIISLAAIGLSACTSTSPSMWQGGDVLVEARQEVLEKDVYTVSDNHRELKDRFDALERLYVELVQGMRRQERQMDALEKHVSKVQKDPQAAVSMQRLQGSMSKIEKQMKKLENRVFSVEVTDTSGLIMKEQVPTGNAVTGASVQPTMAKGTPAKTVVEEQQAFFGVHLASYRSQEQVSSGWAGLEQSFGGDLEGLTPLIYTQSQEGIGTFLRLIAGPLITEQEATALCGRIRQTATEQYCRISEYQGEPIG